MSSSTEFTELHELIGGLRRCVTSLASKYGDSPATRRIVNDAERILIDIDRLDIDAEELELGRGLTRTAHAGEKIPIPEPNTTPTSGATSATEASPARAVADVVGRDPPQGKATVSAPTADRAGTGVFSPGRAEIPQRTLRTDQWWQYPVLDQSGFRRILDLRSMRASCSSNYYVAEYNYLTPFYSPCISTGCEPGASHFWRRSSRTLVASVRGVVAAVPAGVPADLLLLPQGLLPVGVAVPAGMRGRRTAREVHRRDSVSADHPEHAPVLLLHRLHHLGHQHLRRDLAFHSPSGFGFGLGNVILSSTWCCCGCTRCHATPAGTSSADGSNTSPNIPCGTGCGHRSASERAAHDVCLDHAGNAGGHRLLHHAGRQRHDF